MARQAVITGLGIVSPIGVGVDAFWRSALAGRSGIGRPTLFEASNLPPECQIVGEVRDFDPRDWMPSPAWKMAGRFSQFAVAAAKMAGTDARLQATELPPRKLKVAIGTAANGQSDIEQPNMQSFLTGGGISPWGCLEYPAHAAASHVSIDANATGQTTTFASACAAGIDAIAWGAEQVRHGLAVAVLAGGTDAPLSEFTISVFHAVGVLSRWAGSPQEASRPYDALRSGLVLAEGAAVVVIEDEEHAVRRGAPIYARILGYAAQNEGRHLRKVDLTGQVASQVLEECLHVSNLRVDNIDYICGHGNSMTDYDTAETAAVKRTLGRAAWNVPISSAKSMCGQALAASSAIQVVASCLALRDQVIPPTINYEVPDPFCDLDYVPNRPRPARVRTVLIHAHSLGGSHVAMALSHPTLSHPTQ
jgi:3-oxoacyl-[acyl-carrier-protein] synthase II